MPTQSIPKKMKTIQTKMGKIKLCRNLYGLCSGGCVLATIANTQNLLAEPTMTSAVITGLSIAGGIATGALCHKKHQNVMPLSNEIFQLQVDRTVVNILSKKRKNR